jgi:hypothetical protein
MPSRFEYEVVEEPNVAALTARLERSSREGWEALSLACAGESRLLVLLRRRIRTNASTHTIAESAGPTIGASERPGEGD